MRSPDELSVLFHRSGRKVTSQRQFIFQILHENPTHPSAEAVYAAAKAAMPTISLRTVYQTLNDLAKMGELAVLDVGTGAARFDPDTGVHHHLVCISCGAVRDLFADFSFVAVPRGQKQGFTVGEPEVVFRGLCENCAGDDGARVQRARPTRATHTTENDPKKRRAMSHQKETARDED